MQHIGHALLSAEEELRSLSQKHDGKFKRGMQWGERKRPMDMPLQWPKCHLLAPVYPTEFTENWPN